MFASGTEENADWLLYCGGWRVGRVHRAGGAQQRVLFAERPDASA